jgi:hypothetical protein
MTCRKGDLMRELVRASRVMAILSLASLATTVLIATDRREEFRTADLGIDTSVPGGRLLTGGSHASIDTEWGLLGFRHISERRDGFEAPWSRTSEWRILPLCVTAVLTLATWTVAMGLILRFKWSKQPFTGKAS